MNTSIPELTIEQTGNGLILLEQDSGGNIDRVAIHPVHLRFLAEKLGLAETSDPRAFRTIATLKRRLRLLRDRIDHLWHRLTNHPDRERADIDCEIAYLEATSDLVDEFCTDMGEQA